nr:Arm DNA-binding domain-containing protein [Alicycliphilus denitrificans]
MTSGNLLVSLLAPEVPNNPDTNKIAFMPLTDTFIKALKPDPSASAGTKYSDGHGLYLHAKESGKYWRMAYRFGGKQKTLALGTYPPHDWPRSGSPQTGRSPRAVGIQH